MPNLSSLLAPRGIAVVGASQGGGRGSSVITNLRGAGFGGAIYAVNPRYSEVLGCTCYPSVGNLPSGVDCLVVAVGADAACDVLDQAHASGIPAAVVLAAGFGEGGFGAARAQHLKDLAAKGMAICGPNCFGFVNVKDRVAAFSGQIPLPLRPGPAAIVSQSGGLGASVFVPLMADRQLGFSHFISCGNQLGATIEDFVEYLVDDRDVQVIAIIAEALKSPRKLAAAAARANAEQKTIVLYQAGSSAAGQVMVRSHTGALAGNSEVLAAFLRRCGVVQTRSFDEFVEAIEVFAHVPRDLDICDDVIVVSGSGGGAAVASDALDEAGVSLAQFEPATKERLRAIQPDFASITNPIDGTGAIYDDAALLPKIFDVLVSENRRPVIAASVNVRAGGGKNIRRLASVIADAARASGRTFAAYQYSPLGGPLDTDMIEQLHSAHVPVLLGTTDAMRTLRYLPIRRSYWSRAAAMAAATPIPSPASPMPLCHDFLSLRKSLQGTGIAVVETIAAHSEDEAVAAQARLAVPVAVKAEAPGLLHKSDIGCVRLDCATTAEVARAYADVQENARRAGFQRAYVLIQPIITGVAEAYAGVIDDAVMGPAVCFGLGGIFVEVLNDVRTEMAPLSHEEALAMVRGVRGASLFTGARGRQKGDVDALATLLVQLGEFGLANAGRFRALDLNPVIVKPAGEGVMVVDIALEV